MAVPREDYDERRAEALVMGSEIPAVVARHDRDVPELLDLERWTVLDRPAPALCADRIDYTLRDLVAAGRVSAHEAREFVADLVVVRGLVACRTASSARWLATAYERRSAEVFQDPVLQYANLRLAHAVRHALVNGVLDEEQLMTGDPTVLALLRASGDPVIVEILSELTPRLSIDRANLAAVVGRPDKRRTVDPPVQVGEQLLPVSNG